MYALFGNSLADVFTPIEILLLLREDKKIFVSVVTRISAMWSEWMYIDKTLKLVYHSVTYEPRSLMLLYVLRRQNVVLRLIAISTYIDCLQVWKTQLQSFKQVHVYHTLKEIYYRQVIKSYWSCQKWSAVSVADSFTWELSNNAYLFQK